MLRKGKLRKGKRDVLSLICMTRRNGVKELKIPFHRFLTVLLACAVFAAVWQAWNQNRDLREKNAMLALQYSEDMASMQAQVDALGDTVAQQQQQISADSETLETYLSRAGVTENATERYRTEYENLIVAYIDKNEKDLKVSRGGDGNASFIEDVSNLRSLLEVAENAETSDEQATAALSDKAEELSGYLDSLPTLWPVDAVIGSDFGMRLHPVYNRYIRHTGVDMGAPTGTPIQAAGTGTVVRAETVSGYGKLVEIQHRNGYSTFYAHCSELLVKSGDKVTRGQTIAKVGQTGTATESHLHFEVRINDEPVDPKNFISR